MVTILGSPVDLRRTAVVNTARRGLDAGEAEPSWIVVEGSDTSWIRRLFLESPTDRRRGIAAVLSDRGLEIALAAGVGGAVWLPPSTARMREAMRAAAAHTLLPDVYSPRAGRALVAALGGAAWLSVTFFDRAMWCHQLGVLRLERLLMMLAQKVGRRFVLVEGPTVFLDGCSEGEAIAGWAALGAVEPLRPLDGLCVGAWRLGTAEDGACSDADRGRSREGNGSARPAERFPVFELPTGRHVGSWQFGEPISEDKLPGAGWVASGPYIEGGIRYVWKVRAAGQPERVIPEVINLGDLEAIGGVPAVRIPGWAAADLRSGAPGGLLLERLLPAANARGVPLWVPNVTGTVLHRLLQLGGHVWIDGPAVPTEEDRRPLGP